MRFILLKLFYFSLNHDERNRSVSLAVSYYCPGEYDHDNILSLREISSDDKYEYLKRLKFLFWTSALIVSKVETVKAVNRIYAILC